MFVKLQVTAVGFRPSGRVIARDLSGGGLILPQTLPHVPSPVTITTFRSAWWVRSLIQKLLAASWSCTGWSTSSWSGTGWSTAGATSWLAAATNFAALDLGQAELGQLEAV